MKIFKKVTIRNVDENLIEQTVKHKYYLFYFKVFSRTTIITKPKDDEDTIYLQSEANE